MSGFNRQIAVITGATGSIGTAMAGRLGSLGARLFLTARSEDGLDRLVRESGWNSASVRCLAADLAVEEQISQFAQWVATESPRVDVLFHAAGVVGLGEIARSPVADFDRLYQINVRAPYQLTQALLPQLVSAGGQVVFMNSSVGINARQGVGQYAATKHALRAVANALREEVNGQNVRVLSVFLGRMVSRMQQAVHQHEGRPYAPATLLQPDDVASMIIAALELPRTAEVTDLHIRPMHKPWPPSSRGDQS
jgi:NADP-dependent 3-hydroxy acid dehydrogenase YdfG